MTQRRGTSPEKIDFCIKNKDRIKYDIESGIVTTPKGSHGCGKSNQYLSIKLAGKTVQVHTFLCAIKYGHQLDWMTVNHKNLNKHDNREENLEIISLRDNILHEHKYCKFHKKETRMFSKKQIDYIQKNCRLRDKEFGEIPLAKKFNCHPHTIQDVYKRVRAYS